MSATHVLRCLCLAAHVAALAAGGRALVACSDGCAGVGCPDVASVQMAFAAPADATTFAVRVCKNESCGQANVDAASVTGGAVPGSVGQGYIAFSGALDGSASLVRSADGSYALDVEVYGPSPWSDGDVYSVTVDAGSSWRVSGSGAMAYSVNSDGCSGSCSNGGIALTPSYQKR